jgi:hypothetical protein
LYEGEAAGLPYEGVAAGVLYEGEAAGLEYEFVPPYDGAGVAVLEP